jgi:hypothetical protein
LSDKDTPTKKYETEMAELEAANRALWATVVGEAMASPLGAAVTLSCERQLNRQIQLRWLQETKERVLKGDAPGTVEAYDKAIGRLPLGKLADRTSAGVFVLESESVSYFHAANCASTAYHAARVAIPDQAPQVVLINRFAQLDGKKTVRGRRATIEFPNEVLADERAFYSRVAYPIISSSFGGNEASLISSAARKEQEQFYLRHYGPKAIFVSAAGNEGKALTDLDHDVFYHNRRGVRVGAADTAPAKNNQGVDFLSYVLASYSGMNPTFAGLVSPEGSKRDSGDDTIRFIGTSSAAPRLAAEVVLPLVARFGKTKDSTKVHDADTILAALKLTAHPLWVRGGHYSTGHPVVKSDAIVNRRVGDRYISEESGFGIVQADQAHALLLAQEAYARAHPESVQPLKTITGAMTQEAGADKTSPPYTYMLTVGEDVLSNIVSFNLTMPSYWVKDKGKPQEMRADAMLYLVAPEGTRFPVLPSSREPDSNGFLIAQVDGLLGIPAKGQWRLQSSKPIEKVEVAFENAIPPGHFLAKVTPDYTAKRRSALNHADFSKCDRASMSSIPFEQFDLSRANVPDDGLRLRIMREAANGRFDVARKLLDIPHPGLERHRKALTAALDRKDIKALLKDYDPAGPSFDIFLLAVRTGDETLIKAMLQSGYAKTWREESSGFNIHDANQTTAMVLAGSNLPNRQALIDVALANGVELEVTDERGRTLLHHAAAAIAKHPGEKTATALFKHLVEDKHARLLTPDTEGHRVLRDLLPDPALVEYAVKKCPQLLRHASDGSGEYSSALVESLGSEKTLASFIKLAELGADLGAVARALVRSDGNAFLDKGIRLQREKGFSSAKTAMEILADPANREESSVQTDGMLRVNSEGRLVHNASLRYALAVIPAGDGQEKKPLLIRVDEKEKSAGVMVVPLKEGLRSLEVESDVNPGNQYWLVVSAHDLERISFADDGYTTKIGLGGTRVVFRHAGLNHIDPKNITLIVGEIRDGKVIGSQRIQLDQLQMRRAASLTAGSKTSISEQQRRSEQLAATLGAFAPGAWSGLPDLAIIGAPSKPPHDR